MTSTITDRVYGITSNVAVKAPVRVATTAAITLSGAQTIDGVAVVADDRVLVKDQASSVDNGIYTASNSTWERAADFDGVLDVVEGTLVFVTSGSVNTGIIFKLTTTGEVTFGTSNITFSNSGLGTSAFLSSIGALGTAADKYIYTTGAGVAAEGDITSLARNLLDDAATGTMQTTLGASAIGKSIFTAADAAAVAALIGSTSSYNNDFRLTLTSGTPVTTSDVTAATTIYCAPYKGNSIALYDGAAWNIRTSAQFSVALGTITNDRMYDVFCYDNAGTPTLEILAWTNNTTRATALVMQDGVLSKTGALTRRYMGSFCTTSTTTTEDSKQKRFLDNYYHRCARAMASTKEATVTWNYSTATFRQANADTGNQVDFVIGVSEGAVSLSIGIVSVFNSTSTNRRVELGIGIDSTTVDSSTSGTVNPNSKLAYFITLNAIYEGTPAAGKHYAAWLEKGAGADTQSWYAEGAAITGHKYG